MVLTTNDDSRRYCNDGANYYFCVEGGGAQLERNGIFMEITEKGHFAASYLGTGCAIFWPQNWALFFLFYFFLHEKYSIMVRVLNAQLETGPLVHVLVSLYGFICG